MGATFRVVIFYEQNCVIIMKSVLRHTLLHLVHYLPADRFSTKQAALLNDAPVIMKLQEHLRQKIIFKIYDIKNESGN